jgi:hypothetical protein
VDSSGMEILWYGKGFAEENGRTKENKEDKKNG